MEGEDNLSIGSSVVGKDDWSISTPKEESWGKLASKDWMSTSVSKGDDEGVIERGEWGTEVVDYWGVLKELEVSSRTSLEPPISLLYSRLYLSFSFS